MHVLRHFVRTQVSEAEELRIAVHLSCLFCLAFSHFTFCFEDGSRVNVFSHVTERGCGMSHCRKKCLNTYVFVMITRKPYISRLGLFFNTNEL